MFRLLRSSSRICSSNVIIRRSFTTNLSYTNELKFFGASAKPIKAFQKIDLNGKLIKGASEPTLPVDEMLKMYTTMVKLTVMDATLYRLQRQGTISFYMEAQGEYAMHVGSAAALTLDDVVYSQYREQGVLMWRGWSFDQFCDQCFSNKNDSGRGRQMPVHYGSKELNFQTVSSPLSTQIPQAAGAAYALKREGSDAVVICYFGDGGASEGDFHAALNFASTLDCPVIFFCRNNGYAISTSLKEQYRGDGIASRGCGYGMETIRVDGNDIFAVYEATAEARKIASEQKRPVLIEGMSYRIGHHSTSDDSTRYREQTEIDEWDQHNNPITRMFLFLKSRGHWTEEQDKELRDRTLTEIMTALEKSEKTPKSPLSEMFHDVLDTPTKQLLEQEKELHEHLEKYREEYDHLLSKHADYEDYRK